MLAAGLIVGVRSWFAANLLWTIMGNTCSWFLQQSFAGNVAASTAAN
jgi:hypothetical protein